MNKYPLLNVDTAIPTDTTDIRNTAFEDCERLIGKYHYKKTRLINGRDIVRTADIMDFINMTLEDDESLIGIMFPEISETFQDISQWQSEKDFRVENGVLLEYQGNTENVIIPKNVTKIGSSAFDCCFNLVNVIIPESVTEIDDMAFVTCEKLKKVIIPKRMVKIGDHAFDSCLNNYPEKYYRNWRSCL